jgi:beta-N-acetylhexosaminidase
MEDRPPPDDDPFEWTDAPPRKRRRREREDDTFNTGERDSFSRERDTFGTGDEEAEPLPRPGDPYEPSRSWLPTPSETEERDLDTGEREIGTGEREFDAGDTGEETAEKPPPRPGDPYEPPAEAYDTGESDPYETGERPYPTGEEDLLDTGERRRPRDRPRQRRARRAPTAGSLLERHRELPAKVRRRQAIGAGAVVAALIIGGIVLASGGGDGGGAEATPLKRLAGQTIIAPVGERGVDERILKQARKGQIGGVILIGDLQPDDVQEDLQKLRKAARQGDNPPLLVMVDQEGGFVKRLPGPPDLDPNELGESGDPTAAKAEGQKTAQFLKPLGVNVDLAPLMDVNIPQTADTIKTRTFGDDPALVAELGVAFIQGLQEGGVSATAKHFPGLGLSTVNTDFRRVDIAASAEDQQAALEPFQAAVDAGVDLVMMSSAIYPDIDAQNPASLSPAAVQMLRDQLGFDGLVITDDLEARAIQDVTSPEEAGITALDAGDDLILYGTSSAASREALRGIVKAEKKGAIDRAAIQRAYDQVTRFKATLEGG